MTRDLSAANAAGTAEIAILGGGPVGCVLALALTAAGRRCVLVERRAPDFPPGGALAARALAVSHATRLILERLGAWPGSSATAIETIQVSQAGMFGHTRLAAQDAGVPALGYVVAYSTLLGALRARVSASGIDLRQGASASVGNAGNGVVEIRTAYDVVGARGPDIGEATNRADTDSNSSESFFVRCAIHAEGGGGEAAEKTYPQEALAAVLRVSPPAEQTAFERFTSEGPVALLPMAGDYALVWSMLPERARRLQSAPKQEFLAQLQSVMGTRAGQLLAVGERQRFPVAHRQRAPIAEREVFVGNSAQSLHPVAGQGLNLGVRDAWELAELLGDAADPGDAAVLRRYAAGRRFDADATIFATDFLASRFTGSNALVRGLAGIALAAMDLLPGPRRFFARRMIYGWRALP